MRQYKDSGIEWIGKIPEAWKVGRIKDNIIFNPENTNSNEELEVSYMPMDCLRFNQIDEKTAKYRDVKTYTPFEDGDIVMAKVTPCYENGNIAIAKNLKNGRGYGTSEIFVIRASGNLNTEYLFYYLYTPYVINRAVSSMVGTGGLKRINPTYFLNTSLLIPPFLEQQHIADYLNERCGEIDSLVGLQEQMIEKLKAYKQSVITEAVTKGLNFNAKLVFSGVDWIGEIPEEWEVSKAKYFVTINNGSDPQLEGDIPVYGSGATSFKTCGEYKEGPTVLIGRKGATLHIPHFIEGKYWNVDTAFDVKSKGDMALKYYYYLAICFDYKYYISQTTLPGMAQSSYYNMKIPVPSISEQHNIASFLDEKCAEIDQLIELKQQKIEKLRNYKKSVIYEAVTGKINIWGSFE